MSLVQRRFAGLTIAELAGIGLLLVFTVLVGAFGITVPVLGVVDNAFDDLATFLLSPTVETHRQIAVVKIDEATLEHTLRRSPIDRDLLARLLERLDSAAPAAIAVDVLIDQASEDARDERLRKTLQAMKTPVTLAWADGEHDKGLMQPWQTQYLAAFTASLDNPRVVPGSVSLPVDQDGIRRRLPAPEGVDTILGHVLPFAENMLAQTGRPVPLLHGRIAWWGRPDTGVANFKAISADLIVNTPENAWPFMARQLAGRYVFIGTDLPDADRHPIPFTRFTQEDLPGIFIHANIMAQLLAGQDNRDASAPERLALAAALVMAGFLFGARVSSGFTTLALLGLMLAGVWSTALAAIGLIPSFGGVATYFPMADPSLAAIVACIIGVATTRRRFQQERNFVRTALKRYISPAVASRIIADPTQLKIGGERREITALFTDIEGFTTLSETLDPARLATVLNAYLAGMTRIVMAHEGTLDKYIGDAVVAHWGAPLPDPDQAARAVLCAMDMAGFAAEFAAEQRAQGIAFGRTRIGVHSGPAIVGNFGGEQMNYTAIGDTVNTAARLEGANKLFHTAILIGEPTVAASGAGSLRPIGQVIVKGRSEGITLYEPVPDWSPDRLERYLAAYRLLEAEDPGAEAAFLALESSGDPIVRLHLTRLADGEKGATVKLTEK